MNPIYCILVIYNKSVENSSSYQFFNKFPNIQLVVYDNSTREFNNQTKVQQDGHIYISTHENVGLSKAYNACLDVIKAINPKMEGFVCIMDDDTDLEESFMEQLNTLEIDSDIFVPCVLDEIGVLSPCDFNKLEPKRLNTLGAEFVKGMSAINSGLIVSCEVFKDYRYNENLFLDFVDHNFMLDMQKKDAKIALIPVSIHQNFSSNSNTEEQALHRFSLYRHDIYEFYNTILHKPFLYLKMVFKRRLRLMIQYKRLYFLWRK